MAQHEAARTRFAPSPTGFLHVGGVRTALFAWLVARQSGGQFILRIEDTDRSRHVEESEAHIKESLKWLGLDWDEAPSRQSERLHVYQAWAEKLIAAGRAYADPYSPAELAGLRLKAQQTKKAFLFRDHRPEKPAEWREGLPLRFKAEPKSYKWRDEVMGNLATGPEVVDDFIIIKSDGFPTYNFAHVIDDHESGISHVIRSQEFLPSVPNFLNLYEALDIQQPKLATLPYVLGPDGKKKLSKRDGAKDILDYRKDGYLAESLISFLATLGWNDGTTQEIYSRDELIKKFSLDRVQRHGAKFDESRLEWVNGHFIRDLKLDELMKRAEPFWPVEARESDDNYKKAVLELVQERLKYLAELPILTGFFFEDPAADAVARLFNDPKTQKLTDLTPTARASLLKAAAEELRMSDFSLADIKSRLNHLLEKLNSRPKVLFTVIRIAITGAPFSPELFGSLAVLGKDKSLDRMEKAARLDAQA